MVRIGFKMQCVAVSQRAAWHTPQKGRGAKTSRQIHFKIYASQNNHHQAHPTRLQLPGGEYWWLGTRNDAAIIYGDSFVLQRQKIGGPGLVPASREVYVEKYSPRPASPPVVSPRMPLDLVTTLSGMVVIDTDCEEVFAPNTSCTGIVYLGSNEPSMQGGGGCCGGEAAVS